MTARTAAVSMLLIIAAIHINTAAIAADTASVVASGEHEYKAIRLNPQIYGRAARGLQDLLVQDEEGKPVPYFINSYEILQTTEAPLVYSLAKGGSFVKNGDAYDDFFAETASDRDLIATSISVRSGSGLFAKNVELFGSYDGLVWNFMQNDKLYRVDEGEKLTIVFEKPQKYTHYRLRTLNNAEKAAVSDLLSIDGAYLEYSQGTVDKVYFIETVSPSFNTEEVGNKSVIRLFGLKNVRVNELTIHTDNQFKRMAHFASGNAKMLYNLSFGGSGYQDLTLDFNGFSSSDSTVDIEIFNGDDMPITIGGVTLTCFVDDVVFKGENGKAYYLSYGDAAVPEPPAYDIANYKDLILNEGYDLLLAENILREEAGEEARPDYSAVFNAVVIAVSVLLGCIILMRVKRKEVK